jgi:hypothetical protein
MSVLNYSLSTILNLHLPPFTSAVTTAAAIAVVAAARQQRSSFTLLVSSHLCKQACTMDH